MRVASLLAYLALSSIALAAAPPNAIVLDLAKKKFAPRKLSEAEEKLFTSTERGEPASALTGDDKQDDPDNAGTWPTGRIIHAECLAWLCTDSEASRRVTYRGIQIYGMRIDGKLDLEFAQIPFPLKTWKCAFTDEIILRHAHLPALYLQFTHVKNVTAEGVNIDRVVFLRYGFKSEGGVNLLGATIGRDLDCAHGAQLHNPNGKALNADGAKINGYVFLRDGFKAQGEVNLLGATIGRNLECDGAQLSNPNGKALNADGAKIDGYVFLRNGFNSQGEVNLLGVTIGKNLECDGAQLTNPKGKALSADSAKIDGSVFLRNNFKAQGRVSFVSSEVKGWFAWYNTLPVESTRSDLRSAKVGTFYDDEKSWPAEGNLFLDGYTYDRIGAGAPTDARSRIRWLKRLSDNQFMPQPYEQLASVLRNMGHEREARRVMIEKNHAHAHYLAKHGGRSRFLSHEWWWYNVFGWLIGYGYAPSRAFFISLGMIALGCVLFRLGYVRNIISPTDEKGYEKDAGDKVSSKKEKREFSDDYPKFNAFIFSLESFTPLLKLDQSSNWAPNANRGTRLKLWRLQFPTAGSFLRMYLWFHIIAGWVLTSLWVGGITGLVKS